MNRKRYPDEQIAFALRQADGGTAVERICRKLGVSEATFYRWKKQFAGMGTVEVRRLKLLEEVSRKRVAFRRECQAQAAGGRPEPGQDDAAGRVQKGMVSPPLPLHRLRAGNSARRAA